jgi:mannose-1-phosphate guanylyltransferase
MTNNKDCVVILAGGQGTRFWPISRKDRPKQFLSIHKSGESLIQATARRVLDLTKDLPLYVVTNVMHSKLVREHLPSCKIILEPLPKNTAAAIGLAAIKLIHDTKDDPVMICLPADHVISNESALLETLKNAANYARNKDALVTIGVKPTWANTGYGYIKRGQKITDQSYKVSRFYEKPNQQRAEMYFTSGDYYWNAGMFAWRASVILDAIAVYMPELSKALAKIRDSLGTQNEESVIKEQFEAIESTSIDFGVLEHATNCVVVAGEDFGWNDVGSWDAWAEHFQKDPQGNMVKGEALLIDSKNCVVYSNQSKIAILGASDLVVIDSGDALLVCPRSAVQDVKKIVTELQIKGFHNLT